ncbi:hypothetical protein WDH52_02860 [Streptomyces sp. TRM70308]|uniref:hypothetical protein n=1 Tax=Streptomyces sp. TRM70308 TaxID=3131932 RepID=UPI003D009B23
MITLMTYGGAVAADAGGTRTGGVPLVPEDFEWPECAHCGGPMQFLLRLPLEHGSVLTAFMCQNDPGLCEEWDPFARGNRAMLLPAEGVRAATPPATGVTALGAVSGVAFEDVEAETYFDASAEWVKATGRPVRQVLGQRGGEPSWLQGDETPACPGCAGPMPFVAQWEDGHDVATSANFGGGGCAYTFACEPCGQAVFLWQS